MSETLTIALSRIAERYRLDAAQLLAYASEDTLTGWDNGKGGWQCGSLFRVEGQILYALTRALRPQVIVEIGTHEGCSASHFGLALKRNGTGVLYTVDINESTGDLIDADVRDHVVRIIDDGILWLTETNLALDMVFEDGWHTVHDVTAIWRAALPKVREGGFLMSHDADHFLVGGDVRHGIEDAGVASYLVVRPEPSDCGLALYCKESA